MLKVEQSSSGSSSKLAMHGEQRHLSMISDTKIYEYSLVDLASFLGAVYNLFRLRVACCSAINSDCSECSMEINYDTNATTQTETERERRREGEKERGAQLSYPVSILLLFLCSV